MLLQRDHRLLLQPQRQIPGDGLECREPPSDGPGHHRVHLHHARQPPRHDRHLRQQALPLPHLLPDGQPGSCRLLRWPGVLLLDVQHWAEHAEANRVHVAVTAGLDRY